MSSCKALIVVAFNTRSMQGWRAASEMKKWKISRLRTLTSRISIVTGKARVRRAKRKLLQPVAVWLEEARLLCIKCNQSIQSAQARSTLPMSSEVMRAKFPSLCTRGNLRIRSWRKLPMKAASSTKIYPLIRSQPASLVAKKQAK